MEIDVSRQIEYTAKIREEIEKAVNSKVIGFYNKMYDHSVFRIEDEKVFSFYIYNVSRELMNDIPAAENAKRLLLYYKKFIINQVMPKAFKEGYYGREKGDATKPAASDAE